MTEDYVPEHRAGDPVLGEAPPEATTLFSNAAYDKMKWVSLVLLPALGAFYFGLAQLLGLPYGLEVVGVIALVDTFLGTVLGLSTKQYNNSDARFDGAVVLSAADGGNATNVNVKLPTAAVVEKDAVVLKVVDEQ